MFKYRAAVLFVGDLPAARRFYEGLLGQQVSEDYGEYVGFVSGFGIWEARYARRTIACPETQDGGEAQWGGAAGTVDMELYFESADLDAARTALLAAGVPLVHDLREQPWGQRVLRVADPDGRVVEIGEPIAAVVRRCLAQGMSAEETAGRIGIPLALVEEARKK